jgi:NADPH-dependent dioxygenase
VLRGEADDTLLDSYSAERVPVGAELLRTTRMATLLVQLRSRKAAAFLRTAFTVLRNLPPLKGRIQRKIMGGMSALGLGYGESPLTVAASAPGIRPGERLARVDASGAASAQWRTVLDELRRPDWLLLSNGATHHRSLRTVRITDASVAADLGLRDGDWLLVRPDGYVAARGDAGQSPRAALQSLGIRVRETAELA